MGTIPTIQLKYLATGGVPTTPGGLITVQGSFAPSSDAFSDVSFQNLLPQNFISFSVYEDGAPMVDGRVFQVSHFQYSSYPATRGPTQSITRTSTANRPITSAITTCIQRINAPVVYSSDGYTVFYWEDSAPKVTAEVYVFVGRFTSLLTTAQDSSTMPYHGIGAGMIPVFIDAADLATTEITDLDSSQAGWSLGTTQAARTPFGLKYTYNESLCLLCDARSRLSTTTNNTRLTLGYTGTTTLPNPGIGFPIAKVPIVETASAKAYGYFAGGWPRTYRRLDASGSYDWPGNIPT